MGDRPVAWLTEKVTGGSLPVGKDAMVDVEVGEAVEESARPGLERPRAVTVVAVGHLLQGVALSVAGGIFLLGAFPLVSGGLPIDRREQLELSVLGIVLVLLGLLALIATFGLDRLRPWAWSVAMTAQGIGLAVGLSSHFLDGLSYNEDVSLAMGILLVFMLNQNEVRRAFQGRETSA